MPGMDEALAFVAGKVSFLYTDDDGTTAYLETSGGPGYRAYSISLDEGYDHGTPSIMDSYYLSLTGPDGECRYTYGGVQAAVLRQGVLALTLSERGAGELGLAGPQLHITLAVEPSTVDEFRRVGRMLLTSGPPMYWPEQLDLDG